MFNDNKQKKRPIDESISTTFSKIKRSYALVSKKRIKTWKGIIILAFIAGTAATSIWFVNNQEYSTISKADDDIISNTASVTYQDADSNSYGPTSSNTVETTIITATDATLALSPDNGSHEIDSTFTVDIVVDTGGRETDGIDIHYLNYNPSLLEAQSVQPGSLYPVTNANTIDSVNGRIDFSQTTEEGATFNGIGILATITFKALSEGAAEVTFDFTLDSTIDCNISKAEGSHEDILSSVVNGAYILADTTSPTAPTDLAATAVSLSQINLSWTASTDGVGVTEYLIYRCAGSDCTPTIQVGTSTANSYSDTGLSSDTAYGYRVRATDAAGNLSGYSSTASATTPVPPDTTPPANVSDLKAANPTLTSIELSWTAPGDDGNIGTASQYDIRYSTSLITEANWGSAVQCAGEPAPSAADAEQSMTMSGLTQNTRYFFALKTLDEAGNTSGLSNTVQKKTLREKGFRIKISPEGKAVLSNIPIHAIIYYPGTETIAFEGDDVSGAEGICPNFIELTGFEEEMWDVKITISHYLSKKESGITLSSTERETGIEINPLAGNLQDADNVINELDWGMMANKWHSADVVADINQDGDVNTLDWHYLNKNWGQVGD